MNRSTIVKSLLQYSSRLYRFFNVFQGKKSTIRKKSCGTYFRLKLVIILFLAIFLSSVYNEIKRYTQIMIWFQPYQKMYAQSHYVCIARPLFTFNSTADDIGYVYQHCMFQIMLFSSYIFFNCMNFLQCAYFLETVK